MTDIGSTGKKSIFGGGSLKTPPNADGNNQPGRARNSNSTSSTRFGGVSSNMLGSQDVSIIQADTKIQGEIHGSGRVEILGYVEGKLSAETVQVHKGGMLYGTVRADNAEINGSVQGDIFIKHLINIRDTGSVNGNVQYGQLAMETGGVLSAELRNVPPEIAGDLHIVVTKGKSVVITTEDLTAIDPDDDAVDLTYTVSRPLNGNIALSSAPGQVVSKFTQADLESKKVVFVHDGSDTARASFDVKVVDGEGATSGDPLTVQVDVK